MASSSPILAPTFYYGPRFESQDFLERRTKVDLTLIEMVKAICIYDRDLVICRANSRVGTLTELPRVLEKKDF